jgi:hypothetical protein
MSDKFYDALFVVAGVVASLYGWYHLGLFIH